MNCTFTKVGDTTRGTIYRCVTCGTTLKPLQQKPERIFRRCPAGGATAPSLLLRGEMFLTATQRWKMAGSPTRSDEDVQRLAEECCQKCEHLNNGICQLCGCACMTPKQEKHDLAAIVVGKALRNKIRMATEDCPWKCLDCGKSKWAHGDDCPAFRGKP